MKSINLIKMVDSLFYCIEYLLIKFSLRKFFLHKGRFLSFFFVFAWYALCNPLFAQVAVDIFDPFYEDVDVWEGMGLINDVPLLRPYPLQEVKRILEVVLEKADDEQSRRATEHYNRFFDKAYHLGGGGDLAFQFPDKHRELNLYPTAEINYFIFPILSISASISGIVTNKLTYNSVQPLFATSKLDMAADNVKVGSFYILPCFNSGVAIGTPQYYFSAGIARTHFGNFFDDSLFISKNSLHQGQFNFVINRQHWAYTHSFLNLTATDDFASNSDPKKFLQLHALEIRPLSWISFGIVDSIIYGNRFEHIYFLPFSAFFISQGLYDFPDNSLIGLFFSIKPYTGLKFDMALNSDDLGFNEIVKFKKDAKWRIAGQFGFSYTMPRSHWFTSIKLDYTFVTPYTYTHVDSHRSDFANYKNYTHAGSPLATSLWPNSDRISLKLKFRPKHGITLDFFNTFIRHANATESIDDPILLKDYFAKDYNTDGSALSHPTITTTDKRGDTKNKTHAFLYSTPFMKQQTIQYINQLGFLLSFNLPILRSGGRMFFSIGYTFEANINPGVMKSIYKPNKDFKGWNDKTLEQIASEKGKSVDDVRAEILQEKERQLSEWRASAIGRAFNNYIRLSLKVVY